MPDGVPVVMNTLPSAFPEGMILLEQQLERLKLPMLGKIYSEHKLEHCEGSSTTCKCSEAH